MTKIPAQIANRQLEREQQPCDPFEAEVRKMLKGIMPRRGRENLAAALTQLLGNPLSRTITKAQLDNFIAEGKCQPRLPLSLAKALSQLVDAPSLRRYLNNDEDLALIEIGEHARATKRLVAQIATPSTKRSNRRKP